MAQNCNRTLAGLLQDTERKVRNAKCPTDGIPHTSLQMSIMQMPLLEVVIPR